MTEHTPGPWKETHRNGTAIMAHDGNENVVIAQVKRLYVGPFAGQEVANKRLIIAAPALLEALETLARESGELAAEFMNLNDAYRTVPKFPDHYYEAREQASAAIAAARAERNEEMQAKIDDIQFTRKVREGF